MNPFLCALTTLTRFPVRLKHTPSEDEIRSSANWFPLVGLLIACVVGVAALILECFVPIMLRVVLLVFLPEFVTGAFHLDGLADTADGFMSSRTRERILEIMHDSRIGTMGVLAIVFWTFIRFGAILNPVQSTSVISFFFAALYGRCAIVYHLSFCKYARQEGLGRLVFEKVPVMGLVFAILFSFGIVLLGPLQWKFYLPPVLLPLWCWLWSSYCKSKIGGGTGDTLGACEEITEILVLIWFALIPL